MSDTTKTTLCPACGGRQTVQHGNAPLPSNTKTTKRGINFWIAIIILAPLALLLWIKEGFDKAFDALYERFYHG